MVSSPLQRKKQLPRPCGHPFQRYLPLCSTSYTTALAVDEEAPFSIPTVVLICNLLPRGKFSENSRILLRTIPQKTFMKTTGVNGRYVPNIQELASFLASSRNAPDEDSAGSGRDRSWGCCLMDQPRQMVSAVSFGPQQWSLGWTATDGEHATCCNMLMHHHIFLNTSSPVRLFTRLNATPLSLYSPSHFLRSRSITHRMILTCSWSPGPSVSVPV